MEQTQTFTLSYVIAIIAIILGLILRDIQMTYMKPTEEPSL